MDVDPEAEARRMGLPMGKIVRFRLSAP